MRSFSFYAFVLNSLFVLFICRPVLAQEGSAPRLYDFVEDNNGRTYTGVLSNGFKLKLKISSIEDKDTGEVSRFVFRIFGRLTPARYISETAEVEAGSLKSLLATGRHSLMVKSSTRNRSGKRKRPRAADEFRLWFGFHPSDVNHLVSSFGVTGLNQTSVADCKTIMSRFPENFPMR